MQFVSHAKTILVTGSNKGIGFGILKGLLLKNANYRYILTSRDEILGTNSLNLLRNEFEGKKSSLFYHQLDITDKESIKRCLKWIKKEFGQIDILVNNAAVYYKGPKFDTEIFEFTFKPNVFGLIDFTETVIAEDLIKSNGKIVMIGSTLGLLKQLKNDELLKEFTAENLEVEKLLELSGRFRKSIENNRVEEDGWPRNLYSVSKMIVNSYPRVLAKRKEMIEKNIGVYSCHPGWVKTDMGGANASLSIEEGVDTPIYVIELEDGINEERQGKYFDKCKVTSLV